MIPQDVIDNIINTANIVDVIGDYVKLKKAGVNYKGVCPFHGDNDASLVVSPAKNIWKCFGCGKGGNVITFVKEHEGMSFFEAVKLVASKYNITVPERELTDDERKKAKEREALQICLTFAQETFTAFLKKKEAAEYLETRGITPNILSKYGAGYSSSMFTALTELGSQKGYDMATMEKTGLIIRKENGKIFDRFVNRITFPFYSLSGLVIGFTGRSLDKDTQCKYLNSPETPLFHKGKTLFGIYQARQEISKSDKCYLVEGQFDVLSFVQSGYPNTVCGSGTALTLDQVRIIKKFTRNVTAVYDGDAAGMKASVRNMDIMLAEGMNVRAVLLPEGEDPDSFARKMGTEKLAKFLKKQETDFISFIYKAFESEMDDPIRKTEVLRIIAQSISVVPDKLQRQAYIVSLAERFNADGELITNLVAELQAVGKKSVPAQPTQPGLTGVEEAEELVKTGNKQVTLTWSVNRFSEGWGVCPVILITGIPGVSEIQELRRLSPIIRCRDKFEVKENMIEPEELSFLRSLTRTGFTVSMSKYKRERESYVDEKGEERYKLVDTEKEIGFNEYYIGLYSTFRESPENIKKIALERCSEVISYADATTRAFQTTDYARMLGVTKTALEHVLKPYLDIRKSEARFNSDALQVDGASLMFDPSRLPDYVDSDPAINRLWRAYQFFPYLDKNGRKLAYIFANGKKSFMRVGNFYIEPLLHVYDKESQANKRIVELTQANYPYPIYMEWISAEMLTLPSFKKRLWEEGDINFSNGTQNHLDLIMDSWAGKFKKCFELRMFGWYDEGFFAFSNAIVHDIDGKQQLQYVSDLGLVEHNKQYYYIPAFSKIYASERRDSDRYYLDRFIKYREPKAGCSINFQKWASLMNEVYKLNNNGMWAIIYSIMSAFRSDIYNVRRTFTALFFIGPTGSGKSQVGYSIRSLSMSPDAPAFNLNSGTPAALFSWLERYRNIPIMLEEYNDTQINPVIFQALKSAVYDGEGKQKRKDAVSKEIDSSQVNAALVIMGQESPQQDDNSLANRCIICEVPKRDDRSELEEEIFNELKGYEESGLHSVLLEILACRNSILQHYKKVYDEVFKSLKDEVRVSVKNTDGLSRILETVSMFVSVCRIVEEHTSLQLPFTAEQFFEIAIAKVIKQVESISSSNKMFNFFSILNFLIDTGSLVQGRDYKIEVPGKVTIKKQGRDTEIKTLEPIDTRVLYLNMTNIYPMYTQQLKGEAFSLQSLNTYFESNEAYIGKVRSTRYRWQEVKEVPKGDILANPAEEPTIDNSMKRIMVNKESNTSAVCFNYDILRDLLDVDFERDVQNYDQTPETEPGFRF